MVRRAVLGDVRVLAELHVAAWQAAYKNLLPDDFLASLTPAQREEQWRNSLRAPEEEVYLFEDAGRPVAFSSLGRQRDPDKDVSTTKELYTLYALPEVWGQGAGRALWLAMLKSLTSQGFEEVTLWVLNSNARAIRFYEKAGFIADSKEKHETWRNGLELHELRYVRPL